LHKIITGQLEGKVSALYATARGRQSRAIRGGPGCRRCRLCQDLQDAEALMPGDLWPEESLLPRLEPFHTARLVIEMALAPPETGFATVASCRP